MCSFTPSLEQATRAKLRAKHYILHKAGLKELSGDHSAPSHETPSSGCLLDGFTTVHSAARREVDTRAAGTAPVAAAACREARTRGIPTGTQPRFSLGAALSHSNSRGLVQFLLLRRDQSYPSHP